MTQVTLLPLSKQLYEKGLKIETEKWWMKESFGTVALGWKTYYKNEASHKGHSFEETYPAPSTDELLAVMPRNITIIHIGLLSGGYALTYETNNKKTDLYMETGKSLPEIFGKMCLWLLENSYEYDEEEKCLIKKD